MRRFRILRQCLMRNPEWAPITVMPILIVIICNKRLTDGKYMGRNILQKSGLLEHTGSSSRNRSCSTTAFISSCHILVRTSMAYTLLAIEDVLLCYQLFDLNCLKVVVLIDILLVTFRCQLCMYVCNISSCNSLVQVCV